MLEFDIVSKQLMNVQHAEIFGYKLTEQFLISGIELEGFSQVLSRIDEVLYIRTSRIVCNRS